MVRERAVRRGHSRGRSQTVRGLMPPTTDPDEASIGLGCLALVLRSALVA